MAGVKLWLWDKASKEWKPAQCNAEGKLEIASVEDAEISQTTPEDLRHVPHGYYAAGPSYLPLAVNVDGKLLLQTAALDHLNDIGDVNIAAPSDLHLIRYDTATGKWVELACLTASDAGELISTVTNMLLRTKPELAGALHFYSHTGVAYVEVASMAAGEMYLLVARLGGHLNADSKKIYNLADPAAAQDADTKAARNAAIGTHTALATGIHSLDKSARVYHNVDITIPNITNTILPFNSERWDTDAIHDNVTNNSRLTCKTAGKYTIAWALAFLTNVVGHRISYCDVNGVTRIAQSKIIAPTAGRAFFTGATIYDLAVNDYIELGVYQDSGGNLNVDAAPNYSPEFMMARIA